MAVSARQVIRVPIDPFFIAKATVASIWKCRSMQDTFIRDRTNFEKCLRSVEGDLAKQSLKKWLMDNGMEVTDWDDIRTSWRSQRKNFDLQVNGHNIEVRSSFAKGRTLQEVIREEHIIHPCNVRVKEITVQVFFPDGTCQESWLLGWAKRRELERQQFRAPRRIGTRLVDFYFLPFNHRFARPMQRLIREL